MEEHDEGISKRLQAMKERDDEELRSHTPTIEKFKAFALEHGLTLTDEHFEYSPPVGVTANYPNIVELLGIEATRDDEKLVDFKQVKLNHTTHPMGHGLLLGANYILLAHPFFRRGFHRNNNFAPRFVEQFWRINDPQIEPYIALDFDRVRINVDNTSYMELDTWYGAKFNQDITSIKDDVVKLRPPLDISEFHNDFMFANSYSLDIVWKTEGLIKNFQAEEFKTENVVVVRNGATFHPVRYVHAEYNLSTRYFQHFDGAIHYYTPDEYFQRRDSDMNYNSKNAQQIKSSSEKLFKLNGVISLPVWTNFISHFMTGNPLVFEYFEGQYPERITEILTAIRKTQDQ